MLLKNKSLNLSDQVLIVSLMCMILIESNCLRLRVELSHLSEHKFRHNFQDSIGPFCNCGRHIETKSKKTNPKITILEMLVYFISACVLYTKILFVVVFCIPTFYFWLCFVYQNFISGCVLYTKISRIVIFGLVFLLCIDN